MEWSDRIGRRIRLRDLHILLATVHHKSLSKAAEHLAISRPVVSKAIADLEHVLGVRLLERDRHGTEPTIYGAALLRRAAIVFDELRASVKDIEFLADPTAGEIRIGCHQFLATGFVSAVIDYLFRRHSRITFHVMPSETATLHQEVEARRVDLLVAWRLGPLADKGLAFEPLFEDSLAIAAGVQHRLARRRRLSAADMKNECWALPAPESILGKIEVRAFRAAGLIYPEATVLSVSPHVLISHLATGRFLTIVPDSVLRFPVRNPQIKTLPIGLPMSHLSIGIVTVKDRIRSPITNLFIEAAHEVATRSHRVPS